MQIGDYSSWYIHVPPVDPDDNGGAYNVKPETVCQFTGLTDSDGIKGFDGDILKVLEKNEGYEWIGRVEFGNPNGRYTWGWQLVWMGGENPNADTLLWFDMEESGAYSWVVGNVHDKEGEA